MERSSFVNTLPYISNPIEEFSDFTFVKWESDIYPLFKGGVKESEVNFFVDLISNHGLRNIVDLGVGSGLELAGIVKALNKQSYPLENAEANEVDDTFIKLASEHFSQESLAIPIHKA